MAFVTENPGVWDDVDDVLFGNWTQLLKGNTYDVVAGYGATGDGSTDDEAAIESAITAAAVNGGTVFFPTTANSYKFLTAITVPANVTLKMSPGASFSGDGSSTLTVNGDIEDTDHQIFQSTMTPAFGAESKVPQIKPQWFGATGNGSTDDTTAIQAALDIAVDNLRPLYFPPGNYLISSAIAPTSTFSGLSISGAPNSATQIAQETADTDAFTFGSSNLTTITGSRITVRDLVIGTVAGTGSGITLNGVSRSYFENIHIPDAGNASFRLSGCKINTFINCSARGADSAIYSWLNGITSGPTSDFGFLLEYHAATAIECNVNCFYGCAAASCDVGFKIDGNSTGQVGDTNLISGGEWEGNTTSDIHLKDSGGFRIVGAYQEGSGGVLVEDCWGCSVDLIAGSIQMSDSISCRVSGFCVTKFDADCQHCIDETLTTSGSSGIQNIDESNTTIANRLGAGRFDSANHETIYGIADKGFLVNSNSGLEEWTEDPVPVGWASQGGNTTITKETTIVHSGSASAKIVVASTGAYEGLKFNIPSEYLGQWISVECWLRVDGPAETTGRPAVSLVWDTGSSYTEMESSYITDDTWFKFTVSVFVKTAAMENAYVLIGNRTSSTITMYLDDVRIWSQWDPYESGKLRLLSVTNIPLNANGDSTIFTVPTNMRCILDHAKLVAGADASTSDISIGQNTAETDFIGVTNLDNLDAANDMVVLAPVPSATPATLKSYAAGTVIEAQVSNQAGGATNQLYLYGTLYNS